MPCVTLYLPAREVLVWWSFVQLFKPCGLARGGGACSGSFAGAWTSRWEAFYAMVDGYAWEIGTKLRGQLMECIVYSCRV
jgi:hypothetical protein